VDFSVNRKAALILSLLIFGIPGILYWSQRSVQSGYDLELIARMAENGGWSQESITVPVDKPFTIRLSSDDVVHGFAIGRVDHPPVDINPGEWSTFSWIPDQPGEYTFHCTRWCGPNHWRMTGTINVNDPSGTYPTPTPAPPPRYLSYGVDIDDREVLSELQGLRPSTERGSALDLEVSHPSLNLVDSDLTTPMEAFEHLRSDPVTQDLTSEERWDLVASLWIAESDQLAIAEGEQIYEANCAACHGSFGEGDGVMARHFIDPSVADFTDLTRMATANTVLLEGKILRGGMGSGMPYWGSILAENEVGAVIQYLWLLLFGSTPNS
jgi:mono/diheme cytochrome c family protein